MSQPTLNPCNTCIATTTKRQTEIKRYLYDVTVCYTNKASQLGCDNLKSSKTSFHSYLFFMFKFQSQLDFCRIMILVLIDYSVNENYTNPNDQYHFNWPFCKFAGIICHICICSFP